jgi:ABC-type phosphate/phosphonate transport system substrate-binding protein
VARGALGFGIARSVDPSQGRARLKELCGLLSNDVGTTFVPRHPATYRELEEECERGELALAWVPPIATAKLQASGAVAVLALPLRRGAVCYRAALITRPEGPASLSNLQGASIGWVDRESCSGYVMPRLFLAASALNLKTLFSSETFLGSHSAVVDAVVAKRVQVGATFCSADSTPEHSPARETFPPPAAFQSSSPPKRPSVFPPALPPPQASLPPGAWSGSGGKTSLPLRMLATSAPIPNDAIIVSTALPVDLRTRLLRWFLDLKSARAQKLCLDLFGAGGFRVAAPEHFAALQQMMQVARAHGEVA